MKIGEVWKLKVPQNQSPLMGVKAGELIGLETDGTCDDYIFLPVKVVIMSVNISSKNNIEVKEYPLKESEDIEETEMSWFFSEPEFLSLYKKDWELSK